MIQKGYSLNADKTGIASALLCTVHCMVIPALFLVKYWGVDNNFINLPSWWDRLDYVFLLLSFWAVYHSASHTKAKSIKRSLWLFWGILALAIIFETKLHSLAYIASAGLVITHFVNIKQKWRLVANINKDNM